MWFIADIKKPFIGDLIMFKCLEELDTEYESLYVSQSQRKANVVFQTSAE